MIVCVSWFCHVCESKWADFQLAHHVITRRRCPFCGADPRSATYRRT
jgi:hypothetical protein